MAGELGTATIQQVLILKFAFGPEKLLGLSRNAPQGSYLLTKTLTKTSKKWWAGKQNGGAACPKGKVELNFFLRALLVEVQSFQEMD